MESNTEKHLWGIHTQDDALFLEKNIIAIGWKEFGDLNQIEAKRDAYKKHYAAVYPEAPKMSVATSAGMLFRFASEVQIGDYVVFPSKSNRKINIGIVESNYIYCSDAIEYVQQRKVKWLKHLPRTAFSQGALYEIGSALSFFAIKKYADEFLGVLSSDSHRTAIADIQDDNITIAATANDIIETTKDFILKELNRHCKGHPLEHFVAKILEAAGYHTEVTPGSGDHSIDIKVYKDELPPRIIVQVKSQESYVDERTVQSLKGAMREGDYGLFVSLSGFSRNAQEYLRNNPVIKGMTGYELADLILKNYERLDEKSKQTIPLKQVYIPVISPEENTDN